MNQMLQHALPLTVHAYRRDRLLAQRVRQALASLLNTSARSMPRQLKDEGATLQALKDVVRQERAAELLLRTHLPIKQVAHAVGFRNEKRFIRTLRGWTGMAPGEWRRGG